MEKMQGDKIDISVIIPVFNGEENLEELYSRLTELLTRLKKNYEIIFIDDGSIDRTFEILKDFHRSNERIKIIKFFRNFGQFPAFWFCPFLPVLFPTHRLYRSGHQWLFYDGRK